MLLRIGIYKLIVLTKCYYIERYHESNKTKIMFILNKCYLNIIMISNFNIILVIKTG